MSKRKLITILLPIYLLSYETLRLPMEKIDGIPYIAKEEIERKFGFSSIKKPPGIGFKTKYHTVVFYPEANYYTIDGHSRTLYPVNRVDNKLYIQAEDWAYILSNLFKNSFYWDIERDEFIVSKYPSSIKSVRVKATSGREYFVINHNPELKAEVYRWGDGGIAVRLKGGFYRGIPYRDYNSNLLSSYEVHHSLGGATFLLSLQENVEYRVESYRGKTIVTLSKSTEDSYSRKGEKKRGIEVIVIDPGHGGEDYGAKGRLGTKEKDVVLKIAKKLKQLLEQDLKVKVILTRDRDVFLPLKERTQIANTAGADLFISIHANFAKRRKAEGIETFFLSEARTEWERAVEALENASIRYEIRENTDTTEILQYILMDMAQTEFLKESQDLALSIQESLVRRTGRRNRGVKQAGFYVLVDSFCPAVLVETGFMSNIYEEKLLNRESYIKNVAKGILEGIKEFKEDFENKMAKR